ncbi:MAG TPA: aminoacetone oxidase family FAD-binding enzyme [Candidatus Paceibacterota bacterium]|nr:aminoacetone oxidase family FAD-binding enzyme [Candidatus Paceibacterota bacterium]
MKKAAFKERYDVCVVGGGPAGMIAAGRAAEILAKKGAKAAQGGVILLEKNEGLGKKLLITGGGRCNVTNDTPDVRAFLAKLKGKGKFLFSTFAQHAVTESLAFFHDRNMPTKVENEGRVFPTSNSAKSVWDVLVKYMKDGGVEVATSVLVKGLHVQDGKVVGANVMRTGGSGAKMIETIVADSYIIATGGTSHPDTGSTGEGFEWLHRAGHTIVEPDAALVPLKIAEKWVRELSGVSNQNAKLTIIEKRSMTSGAADPGKETRGKSLVGRMVFAHFGISGPLAINLSKDVRESLQYAQPGDKIELSLDIMPDLDAAALDLKVQEVFKINSNKKVKNAIKDLVTPALSAAVITLAKLDPEKEINVVSREERLGLVKTLKDMRMTPAGFLGKEKAIVASGGVKLEEIDFKTMRSRIVPNLYIIGDTLDVERPSGGYSLQLCWSTGWVAGTAASE